MTLTGVKRRAHAAGYDDAIHGRAYRANFQLGESMRHMGLHAEYDAGWESGRKRDEGNNNFAT